MTTYVRHPLYPPGIDTTTLTIAYGDRAFPRLFRELNGDDLLIKQRALMSLSELAHDPEHIATAIRERIVESLIKLIGDDDVTVRFKTAECLFILASHSVGRHAFIKLDVAKAVSRLFDDEDYLVRKYAHLAISVFVEIPLGADNVVNAKLVPQLVEKLTTELDEIKEVIQTTLNKCMSVDTEDALDSGAMATYTNLLGSSNPKIRAMAARNINYLCVTLKGKEKAIEDKCMPMLVKLLRDDITEIRANAAGAIMMIAITTRGKYTALQCDAISPLLECINDDFSEVKTNALRALTCLTEAPEARLHLSAEVDKVRAKMSDDNPMVRKAAERAVQIITWTP